MKPIKVFLMAGGEGSRWLEGLARHGLQDKLPRFKQAVTVGRMPTFSARQQRIAETILKGQDGETIFHRTIRMLVEAGIGLEEIMVVGPRMMWKQPKAGRQFKGIDIPGSGSPPGPILDGMMQIFPLWESERTVVLLGDVVFSYKALDLILGTQEPIAFVGRPGQNPIIRKKAAELFGISVSREMYGDVYDHCVRMTARGAAINYPPKLWALYRLVCGFEYDEYKYEKKILLDPEDYTDDLDSVEEYEEFWLQLSGAALADTPVDAGVQERIE